MIESVDLAGRCQAILRECLVEEDFFAGGNVHQLRIATKRLRAAWQLVQRSVGRDLARTRKAALREISARLSADRDRAVLVGLAEEMDVKFPEAAYGRVTVFLSSKESSEPEVDSTGLIELIEEEISVWEKVGDDFKDKKLRMVRRCVRRNRNRARRVSVKALSGTDPDIWHDWRKSVKRLRYQREFLAELQGRKLGKFDQRVRRLGTLLGQRNDLANLTQTIEETKETTDFPGREYSQLRRTLALVDRDLIRNCSRLGRSLF